MSFLANPHFILQISNAKTFKWSIPGAHTYNNIIQKYSQSHKDRLYVVRIFMKIRRYLRGIISTSYIHENNHIKMCTKFSIFELLQLLLSQATNKSSICNTKLCKVEFLEAGFLTKVSDKNPTLLKLSRICGCNR